MVYYFYIKLEYNWAEIRYTLAMTSLKSSKYSRINSFDDPKPSSAEKL
jgi:hypothetical protein